MKKYLLVLFISLSFLSSYSQSSGTGSPYYLDNGIAIKGYDPVAYFTDKKPVKGDESLRYTWMGALWQFSSKENLEAFKKQPQKYAPQYGGYCAYGVSENHKSPTDPSAWTIVDDKLYLNYNLKVKEIWSKDIPGRIQKAEQHWKTLENESH